MNVSTLIATNSCSLALPDEFTMQLGVLPMIIDSLKAKSKLGISSNHTRKPLKD
jgi:hypothetical protein